MKVDLKCKICGKEFKNLRGLASHLTAHHKISSKNYYDKFYKTEDEGICLYCGKPTKFSKLSRGGYQKYCCKECSYKSDLVKQNREKTNLERFGTKNPYQNKDIKEKIRKKHEHLYGGVGMGSNIIKNKIISTNMQKIWS